jgi:hypothetical protein
MTSVAQGIQDFGIGPISLAIDAFHTYAKKHASSMPGAFGHLDRRDFSVEP